METNLQTIPAGHGVATFVPTGQTIKIINTSGASVISTWAFALPKPEAVETKDSSKQEEEEPAQRKSNSTQAQPKPNRKKPNLTKRRSSFPTQSEAEEAVHNEISKAEERDRIAAQKSGWGSYVPSVGKWVPSSMTSQTAVQQSTDEQAKKKGTNEQDQTPRIWSSYLPSGKAITSYIPKQASEGVSAFAASAGIQHHRDPNKSYFSQLKDFSRTPVGAAGLAAISGSGYTSSVYAGYQAWNVHANASKDPAAGIPEFLSLAHTREETCRLSPVVGDVLVTNLRRPILTLMENGAGGHDMLLPACGPDLENHGEEGKGSCVENLILALGEMESIASNEKELDLEANKAGAEPGPDLGIGLVGAGITVGNAPAPLNLFSGMAVGGDGEIKLGSHATRRRPKGKGSHVKFRAERDVVVVMSACPLEGGEDAHFVVEEAEDTKGADSKVRKAIPKHRAALALASASKVKSIPKSKPTPVPAPKTQIAQPQRRKPIPPDVLPQKESKSAVQPKNARNAKVGAENDATEGKEERKKPRKLAVRSKVGGVG